MIIVRHQAINLYRYKKIRKNNSTTMSDKKEYDRKYAKTINGANIYAVRKICRKYWDKYFIDAQYDEAIHHFVIRLDPTHGKVPIDKQKVAFFKNMWMNDVDRWIVKVVGENEKELLKT